MAVELYNSALAPSSIKSYKTGENHLRKFLDKYPLVPHTPFPKRPPTIGTLALCFFAASLFTKNSIKSPKTIRCYISHAKNYWIKLGCDPLILEFKELSRVLRGISRKLPPKADSRPAFLLPHYKMPLEYRHPISAKDCRKMAAIVFGFFGMLRFHVFEKLNVNSLVLVTLRGLEIKLKNIPPGKRRCLLFGNDLLGFYFDVSDKCHPAARVYLAKMGDTTPAWKSFCPLRALKRLWVHGLLTQTTFAKHNLVESEVVAAMRFVDGNTRDFQTQSLRIGGHTFLVAHGLPEDFVNFLGRRKIKKASQLYYRGSARLTLALFRWYAKRIKFLC